MAVHAERDEVEEHEVRRGLLDDPEGALAVESHVELVLPARGLHEHVEVGLRILEDEDAAFLRVLPGGVPPPRRSSSPETVAESSS